MSDHQTPPPSQQPAQPPSQPEDPKPQSTLSADRPCIRCGFNLIGQTIFKEPHYQMLIVRCPECGTPASLQEYPILGPWARRWGFVLGAAWIMVCIGYLLIVSAIISSAAQQSATNAATPGSAQLVEEYRRVLLLAEQAQTDPSAFRQQFYGVLDRDVSADAYLVDHPALGMPLDEFIKTAMTDIKHSGSTMFNRNGMRSWITHTPTLFIAGLLAAVVLLHHRLNTRLLVVIVPVLTLAAIFVAYWHFAGYQGMWGTGWGGNWGGNWSRLIVATQAGMHISFSTVAFAAVPLSLGLIAGRPLARLFIRLTLPPRLRAPFSALWLADGKPPPIPGKPPMWKQS